MRFIVLAAAAAGLVAGLVSLLPREPAVELDTVLADYCLTCHNTVDWDGGIAFDPSASEIAVSALDADTPDADIWEKAVRKVRAGLMPPADALRPAADVLDGFAAGLEARLDRAWLADPDPGAEPLSRLNRAEYANATRDLLDFDASRVIDLLPLDESVAGFDNIGDGLSVSPTLIEAYVAAAMTIAREAVGERSAGSAQIRYEVPNGLSQDRHIDGLPLATRGGYVFTHNFPLDATYEIRVAGQGRGGIFVQTLCPAPEVVVALNGQMLEVPDPSQFRMLMPAGPQTIAVALLDPARCAGVNELHEVFNVGGAISYVEIQGPFDATGPGDTPSRRRIFSCYPQAAETAIDLEAETACAEEIMSRLATLAYRRPIAADSAEIATLMAFYRSGRQDSDFETGIQHAIARLLMSPQFVFQLEHEPEELQPGETFSLSQMELATRLSFFLWSSIPDFELIETASLGRLAEPAVLEAQVRRMLADPKARALVQNFAGQWLSLRELREALPQDREFDANLRTALELETELLFSQMVAEDLSVPNLLDSPFTFLNERLAEHYGIAGVRGSYMREVRLADDSPRRGLLGHGSWLTATSVADRTSPVIRGEWFTTHLLGAPVPEPPPGVEADLSDEADIAREGDTLRERLERHRQNPVCASCHRIMDPIGLAFENFDLVGRWRDTDNGKPVDTSAVLIDGTPIAGPSDLRELLLAKSDLFVTAFTEKLLTYALGRVVDYRDMPSVRHIVRDAAERDYRFSAIVLGIVASEPFRQRMKQSSGALTAQGEADVARGKADIGDI